jgi:DnaJ-domain-containing protein 1
MIKSHGLRGDGRMHGTAKDSLIRIPVRIEMQDGSKQDVSLISPRALLKMHELMNREEPFVDVESPEGERFIIAKTAIRSVRPRDIPVLKDLGPLTEDKNGFDPLRILKVQKTDSQETIRNAYLALVREYHPDRFASLELPKEINDYLTTMLRRINVAYDMLQKAA